MSVLVFGATGRVGRILSQVDGVIAVSRSVVDLQRPADCAQLISDVGPMAVINAAGCADPERAERDMAYIHTVNGAAPGAMAQACAAQDIPFVHISGVDVFDGTLPMAYIPGDGTNPLTPLGFSRASGEAAVTRAGGCAGIVRTSWIMGHDITADIEGYGVQMTPSEWTVPEDVHAAPTPAGSVAEAVLTIAGTLRRQPEKAGIYHFAGDGDISLNGLARLSALTSNQRDVPIHARPARQLWATPRVISNGRLDCRTSQAVFGLSRPNWRAALSQMHLRQNDSSLRATA